VTEVAGFYAYDPAFPGGVSVAVGDLNGDGVAEIITGAGPGGGPHVKAFSLAGGVVTEVASFYAYDPAFPGGVHVADADLTGDGPHRGDSVGQPLDANHHFSRRRAAAGAFGRMLASLRTIPRLLGSHLIDAELPGFLSRSTLTNLTPPNYMMKLERSTGPPLPRSCRRLGAPTRELTCGTARAPPYAGTARSIASSVLDAPIAAWESNDRDRCISSGEPPLQTERDYCSVTRTTAVLLNVPPTTLCETTAML
jgi:hypothetical protein